MNIIFFGNTKYSTIVAQKTYGEARDWTITVTARDTLNGGDQETLRIVIVDY